VLAFQLSGTCIAKMRCTLYASGANANISSSTQRWACVPSYTHSWVHNDHLWYFFGLKFCTCSSIDYTSCDRRRQQIYVHVKVCGHALDIIEVFEDVDEFEKFLGLV
jgi:hypothetical protein